MRDPGNIRSRNCGCDYLTLAKGCSLDDVQGSIRIVSFQTKFVGPLKNPDYLVLPRAGVGGGILHFDSRVGQIHRGIFHFVPGRIKNMAIGLLYTERQFLLRLPVTFLKLVFLVIGKILLQGGIPHILQSQTTPHERLHILHSVFISNDKNEIVPIEANIALIAFFSKQATSSSGTFSFGLLQEIEAASYPMITN